MFVCVIRESGTVHECRISADKAAESVKIALSRNLMLRGSGFKKNLKNFLFFGSNLLTCAARRDIVIMGMRP